ncbi:MAG TPA: acyltransferase [Solirubrobacteraceae bacterium]|nr:acyltransferase [Solirubrobacteraceae bacterium]
MRNYLPALDGLRAAAVLAVFTSHGTYGRVHGGFIGVEMFFVLSGYLITTLLLDEYLRERRISIRKFYLRRAARLLPALGLVTILVLALYASDPALMPTSAVLSSIPKVWLYVGNWFAASDFGQLGLLGHTWSLAIEEQFYLLWPLALAFTLGREISVLQIIGVLVGLVVLSYLASFLVARENIEAAYYSSHTRAGPLLIGCALALALTLPGLRSVATVLSGRGAALGAVTVLSFALALLLPKLLPTYAGGLFIVAIATAVLIAHIVLHKSTLTQRLGQPVAVWIGKRSYGLYLYHFPIFTYVTDVRLGIPSATGHVVEFMLRVGLTFGLAAVSYRFVEKPVLDRTRVFTIPPSVVTAP